MAGRREVPIDCWNLASSSSSSDDSETTNARRAIEEAEDEAAVDHRVHLESLHLHRQQNKMLAEVEKMIVAERQQHQDAVRALEAEEARHREAIAGLERLERMAREEAARLAVLSAFIENKNLDN